MEAKLGKLSASRQEGNASGTTEMQIEYERINHCVWFRPIWSYQMDVCMKNACRFNLAQLISREGAAPRFHRQLTSNQHWPPDLIETISHLPFKTVTHAFPSSRYLLSFVLDELMMPRPLLGPQIVATCVLKNNFNHQTTTTKKQLFD